MGSLTLSREPIQANHYFELFCIDRGDIRWQGARVNRRSRMHPSTYEYLKPTDDQIARMTRVRAAAKAYGDILDAELPDGPDKTFVIRNHRSNAMWVNVAITRNPDGTPRP